MPRRGVGLFFARPLREPHVWGRFSGLGKTLQALVVILLLKRFARGSLKRRPAVVVAPLSVLSSWETQSKTFLGALPIKTKGNAQAQPETRCSPNSAVPRLRLLTYSGDQEQRRLLRSFVSTAEHKASSSVSSRREEGLRVASCRRQLIL